MPPWLPLVARYIRALADGLDATTQAGDRSQYQAHLADAARLVALLEHGDPIGGWLDAEEHSYGSGFLSGPQGEAASQAFGELAEALRGDGHG